MLSFYEAQLVFLGVICAIWTFLDHRMSKGRLEDDGSPSRSTGGVRSRLMRQYLTVYAIVMGKHDNLRLLKVRNSLTMIKVRTGCKVHTYTLCTESNTRSLRDLLPYFLSLVSCLLALPRPS